MLRKHRQYLVVGAGCIFIALAVLWFQSSQSARSAAPTPDEIIRHSWELVKQSGVYHFEADILQTEMPLAVAQNVGQQSRQQSARLEGQASLPAHQLEFTLWAQGGSVLDQSSGTQVRVDGEKAFVRQGEQAWHEVDDFSASFAPQGDFMSFLAGAKNIRQLDEQNQANGGGLLPAVFAFDVDGPGFAAYLRDRLQAQLESQGKLPPGLVVGLSDHYAHMAGQGQIQIGADGLPRRLAIQAVFPPGANNYQTQAEIITTFSDFGPLSAAQAGMGAGFFKVFDANVPRLGYAAAFLTILGLVLLAGLQNKPVYAALVIVVIAAMVFGPLLQQVKAGAYIKEQVAKGAAQQQQQQDEQLSRQAGEGVNQPRIQPNISPLSAVSAPQAAAFSAVGTPGQAGALTVYHLNSKAKNAAPTDPSLDSDNDGLPDVQERLLGTDPFRVDTDNDTLTDTLEVNGFVYNSQTWYGDPLRPDTNSDGLGDGEEWGKDTNQDGTPDLWSRDNDGDQVPDNIDLSPYQANGQVFDRNTPLMLVIDNLQANTPTYVDFQVRPITTTHLRYAFNVFKWPQGDVAGQMMDADGKTFKDVYPTSDHLQDANGDVKLVPMLEIQINGTPTNLPSQDELQGYGIFVRDLVADGSQKAAYVPLQLTVDSGDNWVAFQGRMFYRPSAAWGSAQQVRLVWAVQALVDVCKEDGFKDGACQNFESYNQLELLQVYPDSFTVTGVNVREDHGASFAFIYQDPAVITDTPTTLTNFTTMGILAGDLDRSFLAGRVGPDGQRDMTLPEIQRRFDHTLNAGVPISPTRFNISENIFRVALKDYEHIDQARYQVVVTDTKDLLAVYTPYWSAGQPFTPTIMLAHEEKFRPLNLDSLGLHNNVLWQDTTLHMSLPAAPDPGSGMDAVLINTLAALNWGPYQYNQDGWNACPIDIFIDGLDQYYPPGSFSEAQDVDEGALAFIKMFYLNIYQGYAGVVEIGDEVFPENYGLDDEALAKGAELFEASKDPWKLAIETFLEMELSYRAKVVFSRISNYFSKLWAQCHGQVIEEADAELPEFKPWSKGMLIKCAFAILLLIITMLPWVRDWMQHNLWGKIFSVAIGGVFFVMDLMKTIELANKFLEAGEGAAWGDFRASGEIGLGGLVFLTVIMIAIQVGYFIYAIVTQHIKIFSIEFDQMLADLIASIIVLIIYAAISEIPIVGPLIVAILVLIDVILGALGIHGISDFLGELISKLIYNFDPIVNPSAESGAAKLTLDNPALGLQVGSTFTWGFPVTTTITHRDPKGVWPNLYLRRFYDEYTLYASAVNYQLDFSKHDIDLHGNRWAEPPQLDHLYHGWPMLRTWARDDIAKGGIALNQAGVNQPVNLWMDMGYWFPAVECITYGCYSRAVHGQNPQLLPAIHLDVFPASLDEFYAWNWANNYVSPFSAPKDWDGDGLLSKSANGNDPDDTRWDTDGDTLSDYYEVTTRTKTYAQGGGNFDPLLPDSDNDGLRDDEELRQGADPGNPDTDQDGLGDLVEFSGYQFTYTAGKTTLVRSSINSADADHDGMDDWLERGLHYRDPLQNPFNPNVWNPTALAMSAAIGAAIGGGVDNYVAPGQNVVLTTTVDNNFAPQALLTGTLTTTLPSFLLGSVPVLDFTLLPGQAITQTTPLSVMNAIPTQGGVLTATACARASLPLVYLPFDEPSGATTFKNQVGNRYHATCTDIACPAAGQPPAPGFSGYSVHFDGSQKQFLSLLNSSSDLNFGDSQPFSMAAWVYPTPQSLATTYFFFGKGSFQQANNLILTVAGDPIQNAQLTFETPKQEALFHGMKSALLGKWYHLAVVYDGNTPLIYLNGMPVSSDLVGGHGGVNTASFTLGGVADYTGMLPIFMTGSMDEFYLYDRAISAAEVAQLAQPPSSLEIPQASPACNLTTTKTFSVTVDADPPTSAISSLQDGQYLNLTTTLIVGGSGADPTSYVSKVDISVDGVGWQPASGSAAWAYAWDTGQYGEGPHTLQSRATDAVGNVETPSAGVAPVIDRTPPDLSASLPAMLRAQPDPWGNWTLPINGQVNDPPAGTAPGSGAASVDVLLVGDNGSLGGGWQPAVITATNWSLVYRFPPAMLDPTGPYTLTAKARDNAGNETPQDSYLRRPFSIDNTPPVAELTRTGSMTVTITTTLTLRGVITDPGEAASGVSGLQIAYVPVPLVAVVSNPLVLMHLDDPVGSCVFADSSGNALDGSRNGSACPTAGRAGKFDEAVAFDGLDTADGIDLGSPASLAITNAFSAALWFSTTLQGSTDSPLITKWDSDSGNVFWLGLKGNQGVQLNLENQAHDQQLKVFAPLNLADGQWHQALGTWDGQAARLYVDGALVGSAASPGFSLAQAPTRLVVGSAAPAGSPTFLGLLDEVMLFPFAFSQQQAAALFQRGAITWQPVTLDQPGAVTSTWSSALPAGLEGIYQIDLRGTDQLGNRNDRRSAWATWRGEIDLLAPRVTFTQTHQGWLVEDTCQSVDFNLVLNNYHCPCAISPKDKTTYEQISDWYRQTFPGSVRLYQVLSTCQVDGNGQPPNLVACDRYGRCSTSPDLQAAQPAQFDQELPYSAVITPADRSVLTDRSPLQVTVGSQALSGLQSITLTLDGEPLHTFVFPDNSITRTLTSTLWAPPPDLAEGQHWLQSFAQDWNGQVQSQTFTTTFWLDTQAPEIDINPLVLTSSHMLPYLGTWLGGTLNHTEALNQVEVSLSDSDWAPASVSGEPQADRWQYPWWLDPLPDGKVYTVTARASDMAGRYATATRPVIVDLVPPAALALTLTYVGDDGNVAYLIAGQVIRDVGNPELLLEWTPGSDGSGVAGYYAGLVNVEDLGGELQPDLASLVYYPAGGALRHPQNVQEGHAYYAVVAAVDTFGNLDWNWFGPVVADIPSTPDYAALRSVQTYGNNLDISSVGRKPAGAYTGWQSSGCAALGINRITADNTSPAASNHQPQRFYATWDNTGLRLSWLGADWDASGDLFIYLDSLPDQGTQQALDPYGASNMITLPLQADYVTWVSQSDRAELWRWDGAQWILAKNLGADQFYAIPDGIENPTDLYLPFASVGITSPADAALQLVAFALEDAASQPKPALQTWAVMPSNNPLNSPSLGSAPGAAPSYALLNAYRWDHLGEAVCPSQGKYPGADLRSSLVVTPAGSVTETRLGGLYLAWQSPVNVPRPLIAHGQVISYSVTITNQGEETATAVRLVIHTQGAVTLPEGELVSNPSGLNGYQQEIAVGDIQSGRSVTIEWTSVADGAFIQAQYQLCLHQNSGDPAKCQVYQEWVNQILLTARLYSRADINTAIETFNIRHLLDTDPPVNVAVRQVENASSSLALCGEAGDINCRLVERTVGEKIELGAVSLATLPPFYVRPGWVSVTGSGEDPVGVKMVTVQHLKPDGDVVETDCPADPDAGSTWLCQVNLAGAVDGERWYARARAADRFGYLSAWSPWRLLQIDTQRPRVELSPASDALLQNIVLNASQWVITGTAQDERQIQQVELCFGQAVPSTPFSIFMPVVRAAGQAGSLRPSRQNQGSGQPSNADCKRVAVIPDLDGQTGVWSFALPQPGQVDGAYQTVEIYAVDAAGNRSVQAVRRTFRLDDTPPQVQISQRQFTVALEDYQKLPTPVLGGLAVDGGGIPWLSVHMRTPAGGTVRAVIPVINGRWEFTPLLTEAGTYWLTIDASDAAGNHTYRGPFAVEVIVGSGLWLPLVKR